MLYSLPSLSKTNPVPSLTYYHLTNNDSQVVSSLLFYSEKNCICTFLLPYMCNMSRTSHPELTYLKSVSHVISRDRFPVVSTWIFSVAPPTEPCALRSTQHLKVSTRDFSWSKGGRCVWLTTYHHCSAETSRNPGT